MRRTLATLAVALTSFTMSAGAQAAKPLTVEQNQRPQELDRRLAEIDALQKSMEAIVARRQFQCMRRSAASRSAIASRRNEPSPSASPIALEIRKCEENHQDQPAKARHRNTAPTSVSREDRMFRSCSSYRSCVVAFR
jgi:hypothetical protein